MKWWKRRKKERRNIIKITTGNTWLDAKVSIIILLVCIGMMLIIGEAYS